MNVTPEIDAANYIRILNEERTVLLIPNIVILSFYIVLNVFGNGLVLYVYSFKLKSKTDDRYFIPILAMADLIACVIGSSFAIAINTKQLTFQNDAACKVVWSITTIATISSGLMLLAIAIQRYIKVCRPFNLSMGMTSKRMTVVFIFLFSTLLSIPSGFLYGSQESLQKEATRNITVVIYSCGVNKSVRRHLVIGYSVTLLMICFIGVFVLSMLYFLLLKKIYKQEHFWRRKKFTSDSTSTKQAATGSSIKETELSELSIDTSESERYKDPNKGSFQCNETRYKSTTNPNEQTIDKPKISLRQTLLRIVRKHKFSIMFLLITILFVVSYFPRTVVMILESADSDFWQKLTDQQYGICLMLYRLYLLNNVVNPIIYTLFDRSFRNACKLICCKD